MMNNYERIIVVILLRVNKQESSADIDLHEALKHLTLKVGTS